MSTHDADGGALPPEIRSALAALPREAEPGRLLEERTGSAYVHALARLAATGDSTGATADPQGREVAAAMLRPAADELLRIAPDDPVAAAVLSVYQPDSVPASSAAETQRVVWF